MLSPSRDKISLLSQIKYEHLISGMIGGLTSTLALHPLDVVKIRFAVNDGRRHIIPKYNGILNALSTILKQEGIHGLYRGVVPNLWGAGASWGFYFLFYNAIKTWAQQGNTNMPLGPQQHLLAASEAGVIGLILTNPLWVCKTRLCLQYSEEKLPQNKQYKGMIDVLVKIYKYEGIKGYYKGFVPGIVGVSHGGVQFMVYEEMKNNYNQYHNTPISTKLGVFQYLSFAAISKLIAVGATYPYQVVRARLQNQYYSYNGVLDCIKQTWIYEGWRGFYKGLGTNLVRVVPATMITFVTYENISSFLMKQNP